jgi:hypothetical protein
VQPLLKVDLELMFLQKRFTQRHKRHRRTATERCQNYLMHLDKGNLPPLNTFWSLSMYNATTFLFVSNSINRYSVSEQKNKFVYNPDSSLDICIQHYKPSGKESNWLPAPKGEFSLILSMYLPGPKIINGTYQILRVQKVVYEKRYKHRVVITHILIIELFQAIFNLIFRIYLSIYT